MKVQKIKFNNISMFWLFRKWCWKKYREGNNSNN
jgi:hypothetical protein